MDVFTTTIEGWHDFYLMIGTAAATLIGLLFVALSLNIELLRKDETGNMRIIAAQTFNIFVYVLLFAVLFLIPRNGPFGLGLPLIGIGAAGLWSTVVQFFAARKSRANWGRRGVTWRFLLPLISLSVVIIIAISVLYGITDGLYWLVPVMLTLLATASRNAWDLLIGGRQ